VGIALLGPVSVDGANGALSRRDRVVLATLAVGRGEALTTEQLADALWGEQPPASWNKIVQGCVVRLRRLLGPQSIETSPQGYRLAMTVADVDAWRFEQSVSRGRELLTLGQPDRAAFVLTEGLALWRGRALGELDDWDAGRIEAARLAELRMAAEELQLQACLDVGRSAEILAEAETLVAAAPLRERRWALLALAQYRSGRQSEALQTVHQVRTVLARELGLDPGPDLVALEQAILQQDPSLLTDAADTEVSRTCPYLGLVPYDVEDADGFFGRVQEVSACLHRLADTGVLVVVGPSGSGKSSLVRAGVAASLRRDGRRVVVVTPGSRPTDALTVLPESGPTPVLVVDQCEEAVSQCGDLAEQTGFFAALADHADRGLLILALRADRLGEISSYPRIARLVERGLYLLTAMDESSLRAAIEGPARQAGLPLEPGLAELLVREVANEPGGLPLMSHALRETWVRREGHTLTVAGYRQSGGIHAAVARSAEDVYGQLPAEQRPVLRELLLRLVTPTPGGAPERNRVPRRLISTDAVHERVIELLVGARLVTTNEDAVELAHESLVDAWPRLRDWLDEDVEGQRIRRHLLLVADTWEEMGCPDSELYRGVRLAQALEWRERGRPSLAPVEQAFLEASQGQVDTELRNAQQRADQEAASRHRARRLSVGLAIALVLTLLATALAVRYQQDADARAADAVAAGVLADANRLAALSATAGSLDLSLLLAAEAMHSANTPEAQDALLAVLLEHGRARRVLPVGQAESSALGNGGRVLYVAQTNGVVAHRLDASAPSRHISDAKFAEITASPTGDQMAAIRFRAVQDVVVHSADGERLLRLPPSAFGGGIPLAIAFTPDGSTLLVLTFTFEGRGYRRELYQVDVSNGEVETTGLVQVTRDADTLPDMRLAEDGSALVNWNLRPRLAATSTDLTNGNVVTLSLRARSSDVIGFRALPTGVAQLWEDGAVTLYDHRGVPTQVLEAHQEPVRDLVVSTRRRWAASVGDGGAVVIWRIDPATGRWSQTQSLTGHTGAVVGAQADAMGRRLLTVAKDGTAIDWDMTSGAAFGAPYPGLRDRWISNRPATVIPGKLIVAPTRPVTRTGIQIPGNAPDTLPVAATFLDPDTGQVVDEVVVGRTSDCCFFGSSVSVSPNRRLVAITSGFTTTVLDARTRAVRARVTLSRASSESPRASPEMVWSTGWTADGSRLLLGAAGRPFVTGDGGLVIVDTTTWQPVRRLDLGGGAQVVELSPDRELLAVANAETEQIHLLDAQTLVKRRTLALTDGERTWDLSFSPDGRWLAAGGELGLLHIFDTRIWGLVHQPAQVQPASVTQVEWLPGGNTIATAGTGADAAVSLYDVGRGLMRARPLPASTTTAAVGFAFAHLIPGTDGEIIALNGDQPGRRYQLHPSTWLTRACAIADRNLTRDEWDAYIPGRAYEQTCPEETPTSAARRAGSANKRPSQAGDDDSRLAVPSWMTRVGGASLAGESSPSP
jgi:DNA-binding SARP family transcriptional activator/WD40 repeat protein